MKIPDEDFQAFKVGLPQCSNIVKPNKKTILEAYEKMNYELDHLKFGRIDMENPEDKERRRKRADEILNDIERQINGYAKAIYGRVRL